MVSALAAHKTSFRRLALVLLYSVSIPFTLVGCGAVPSDGPRPGAFQGEAKEHVPISENDDAKLPFVLVDVDNKSLSVLRTADTLSYFSGAFTDRRDSADIRIGLGDILRITIFEAGSGGLFVPTGGTLSNGNYVSIPDQEVDRTGSITVPYAALKGDSGVIQVHNRRPIEVKAEIEQRLANRAIEPQAVVTIVNRTSNLYSIIGDVSSPGRYSVTQSGIRILDALGMAGGPKASDYNTMITLQRESGTASARLSTLVKEPENNIFVQPNDIIMVKKDERFYNVFGSTGSNNRYAFEAESLTVADALAKAGGLDDKRAQPNSVVIFRREDPQTLRNIGASLASFEDAKVVPTVYRLNLTQPSGFFLAQKMPLQHDDIVYVSPHPFSDASKLLTLLRDILLIRLIDND